MTGNGHVVAYHSHSAAVTHKADVMPLRVGGHSPNLGALADKDARWLRPAAVVISAAHVMST